MQSVEKPVAELRQIQRKLTMQSAEELHCRCKCRAECCHEACVWVKRLQECFPPLVNRYLNEGEAMLKDTNIWVCTTCGFVYIGDTHRACPVCKVPDWKFEKKEAEMLQSWMKK